MIWVPVVGHLRPRIRGRGRVGCVLAKELRELRHTWPSAYPWRPAPRSPGARIPMPPLGTPRYAARVPRSGPSPRMASRARSSPHLVLPSKEPHHGSSSDGMIYRGACRIVEQLQDDLQQAGRVQRTKEAVNMVPDDPKEHPDAIFVGEKIIASSPTAPPSSTSRRCRWGTMSWWICEKRLSHANYRLFKFRCFILRFYAGVFYIFYGLPDCYSLQTRYTALGFWRAGPHLLLGMEKLVTNQSEKEQLRRPAFQGFGNAHLA